MTEKNKVSRYSYEPDYATPPGETLRETIEELSISVEELAIRTGIDKKTIDQIINGVDSISPSIAELLERATGIPSRMWNNLEKNYQERME